MAGDVTQDELARLQGELREAKAALTRTQVELDRAKRALAAQAPAAEGDKPGGLIDHSLLISEVEVRRAVARQLQNAARLLQATKCVYLLFDGEQYLVAQRPALGVDEEQLTDLRVGVNRGISGEVFRTRKAVRVDDAEADHRAQEDIIGRLGAGNGVCVPLQVQIRDEDNRVIDSRAIGVLWVMNRRGSAAFTDDDERILTMFARQVAAVVSNAEFFQRLMKENQTLVSTFENLPAGILFIGEDERIRLINGTARQLFGVNTGAGPGEAYYRAIDHHQTCEVLGASLRDGEDKVAEVPFEVDDEERIFQIQAARVRAGDESVDGVVAIFDDVTEIHRVDRMKTEFVQTFSTELLGPLASIRGFSTMLEQAHAGDFDHVVQAEIQGIINGECERLRRHIQDLLNVSRFEHGVKLHLNLGLCDVVAVVERAIAQQQALTQQHEIALVTNGDLRRVTADEPRLEDVVTNMLTNAVKYSPDGGRIEVRVKPDLDGVRVEVADQGVGIPEEHHETVFQKFGRVAQQDERVRAGRGIGLFISRVFIEAHGGRIGLQSAEGEGATFWFSVPYEPVIDDEQTRANSS
jgi:two-component system phosphate regulon sensor histidine kinase PhoR